MFPNMNPAQMQKMMSQLGIKTNELNVEKVILQLKDGKILQIDNPQVTKMIIQGTDTYQVIGSAVEVEEKISEEDINLVSEQANCSKEIAEKTLKETDGDIAEAIMKLKKI